MSSLMPALERYAHLIEDSDDFGEACTTPLSLTGWLNPIKNPDMNWISAAGGSRLHWNPNSFRIPDSHHPGFWKAFLTGQLIIQEASAMSAVHALPLQKGDSVLDLCAAPGNKTAQVSAFLGETGMVVSNDLHRSRLGVLNGTLDRMGLANVLTTAYNARSFPIPEHLFDHVLADVPCTCEGTSRKHLRVLSRDNARERKKLTRMQEDILHRAIACVKPGGHVLYATCTYSPEENERVVHRVLEGLKPGMECEVVPIAIPGFKMRPGLTSWEGEQFDAQLKRTSRIWPQDNDTGGFYLALLKRQASSPSFNPDERSPEGFIPLRSQDAPWNLYGFADDDLAPFGTITGGRKYSRLLTTGCRLDPKTQYETVGMTGLNLKSHSPRFSTPLALKLGHLATSGLAHIKTEAIWDYFSHNPELTHVNTCSSELSIVTNGECALGLGRCVGDQSKLESFFPRVWGGIQVVPKLIALREKGLLSTESE